MLTVQPNLVQPRKNITSFRGDTTSRLSSEENDFYKGKTDYYQNQINDFNEVLEDDHTPKTFKKIIKGFKVVSEALFEGWMVAWGIKKGSAVTKAPIMSTINGKVAKNAGEIVKPILKGFKGSAKVIGGIFEKLMKSETAQKFITKMENNKVGRVILKSARALKKGINFVYNKGADLVKYIKNKFKVNDINKAYDNVVEKTATVMGTGAGVTGAYRATMHPELDEQPKRQVEEDFDGGIDI